MRFNHAFVIYFLGPAVVAIGVLGHANAAQASNAAFECPVAIDYPAGFKTADSKEPLLFGNAMDDPVLLNTRIDALKRFGVSSTVIVDKLIGDYCPAVSSDVRLSDSEKAARVQRFARKITKLVYTVENESEVILDIPLRPAAVDRVNQLSRNAGQTAEHWIAEVVEKAIHRP